MVRFIKICCLAFLVLFFLGASLVITVDQAWDSATKMGALGLLLAVLSIVLILWQLGRLHNGFKAERVRAKKEATLKMYDRMQGNIRGLNGKLEEKFSLRASDVKQQLNYDDLKFLFTIGGNGSRRKLEEMLHGLDEVGLGVKHGVYDLDIIRDLSASFLPQIYLKYEPFITQAREDQRKKGQKELSYEALIALVRLC